MSRVLTANFKDVIPSEYMTTIVGTLLGIGITAIGSVIYKNRLWFNEKRGVYLNKYMKRIDTAYESAWGISRSTVVISSTVAKHFVHQFNTFVDLLKGYMGKPYLSFSWPQCGHILL